MKPARLFKKVTDMEPLLPEDRDGKLHQIGSEVIRRAERLRGALHPLTRKGVVDLVRSMNSYYSNLIEGHRTTPREIDAALRREFSGNVRQRNVQQLHWAHVETQRWMESQLPHQRPATICSAEFLCELHREFYRRLPVEFQTLQDEVGKKHPVLPGVLRTSVVSVGRHLAPGHEQLPSFLNRFDSASRQIRPRVTSRICSPPVSIEVSAQARSSDPVA